MEMVYRFRTFVFVGRNAVDTALEEISCKWGDWLLGQSVKRYFPLI
jgi:hypothetical protein